MKYAREAGEVIPRQGAHDFMNGLLKTLYHAVHFCELESEEDRAKVLQTIQAGMEYYAHNGWHLEAETFSVNGERPLPAIVLEGRGLLPVKPGFADF